MACECRNFQQSVDSAKENDDQQRQQTQRVRDGKEWVLNGTKTFITNGHYADVLVVNTTGELRDWYHLATVVFMGWGLVQGKNFLQEVMSIGLGLLMAGAQAQPAGVP